MSSVMQLSPLQLEESDAIHFQERYKYMMFLKGLFSTKNKSIRQCLNRLYPVIKDHPISIAIDLVSELFCEWN